MCLVIIDLALIYNYQINIGGFNAVHFHCVPLQPPSQSGESGSGSQEVFNETILDVCVYNKLNVIWHIMLCGQKGNTFCVFLWVPPS